MRFLSGLAALWWLVAGVPAVAAAEPGAEWRDAMTAYRAGDFERAVEGFKKITTDEKQISAALCHNIANAEYRIGDEAAAAMWYRRALAIQPWLPEARQNLRFLQRKLGFLRYDERVQDYIPRRYVMMGLQAAIWGTAISIVWMVWATPRRGRRWPLVVILCLSVAQLGTAGWWMFKKQTDEIPFSKRIVCVKEDTLRTAPAEAAGAVITLKPGSELIPVREEGYWTYCDAPGGDKKEPLRGWIRTVNTERLWPWLPALID